jgi:hypothetical protein
LKEVEMGFISRFLDVFVSPSKIGEEIKEKPKILEPIIIVLIFVILFTFLTARIQSRDGVEYIKMNPKWADKIPQERLEKMANPSQASILVRSFLFSPLTVFFNLLIFSVALLVIVKIAGGAGEFKNFFSLAFFSSYIDYVLGNGIKTILILQKGTSIGVSTGLSLFFPDIQIPSLSYNLLSIIDFFSIWSYIFVAIALSRISKLSFTKASFISAIIFILRILVVALPSILFFRLG